MTWRLPDVFSFELARTANGEEGKPAISLSATSPDSGSPKLETEKASLPANLDETCQNQEVLEAALMVFRGEKRRAGQAKRMLRSTVEQPKSASQDKVRAVAGQNSKFETDVRREQRTVPLEFASVQHGSEENYSSAVVMKREGKYKESSSVTVAQSNTSERKKSNTPSECSAFIVPNTATRPNKVLKDNSVKHALDTSEDEENNESELQASGNEVPELFTNIEQLSDGELFDSIEHQTAVKVFYHSTKESHRDEHFSDACFSHLIFLRTSELRSHENSLNISQDNIGAGLQTNEKLLSEDDYSEEDDNEEMHQRFKKEIEQPRVLQTSGSQDVVMSKGSIDSDRQDPRPISFGDCIGEGLGTFHFGDEDDLTAWDSSPRWSLAGKGLLAVETELSASVCTQNRNANIETIETSYSAICSLEAKTETSMRNCCIIAQNDLQFQASEADHFFESKSMLRDHTSCNAAPLQFQNIYGSLDQIFTAFHRTSSRCASMKIEQLNTRDVSLLYHTLSHNLRDYTSASPSVESPFLQVFRVSRKHPEVYSIVKKGLPNNGVSWTEDNKEDPCETWNLMWTWSSKVFVNHSNLLVWQRINHYPRIKELTRKDLLKLHLESCQRLYGTHFEGALNVMPTTFNLPKEYISFVEQFHTDCSDFFPSSNLWIVKPINLSRGRGICIINDASRVTHREPVVVQRYINNPFLIDGFKWDMRLYVLVTSFNPLEAFIYKEGFARFATHAYSKSPADITNKFIHLTNSSIQGNGNDGAAQPPDVIKNGRVYDCSHCIDGGTKCSLQHLTSLLSDRSVDFSALWDQIVNVILRALFAVQDSIPHQANSFELLGFDIMVDEHQKPWLLEANSSPSLTISSPLDKIIKETLVHDTIALVDPPAFDRRALHRAVHNTMNGTNAKVKPDRGIHSETFDRHRAMNGDLTSILGGKLPRQYGDLPTKLGNYSQIAPSRAYDKVKSHTRREGK
eukprot:CAMPEP_0197613566 /NCGR_PEP_ID=MMETSP1326-20131121/59084_1 /TAXON_ID=1155430 /ORGANISM="Genus nov. species nov., Strain RCC2288" /LENGTH=969 /DNA_ID=CAMNT_0043182429 /DNA_START=633 /DNA_END=3544 /DNA_ORIENTATION=+